MGIMAILWGLARLFMLLYRYTLLFACRCEKKVKGTCSTTYLVAGMAPSKGL